MLRSVGSALASVVRVGALALGSSCMLASPSVAQNWFPWGSFFDGPSRYEAPQRRYQRDRSWRSERQSSRRNSRDDGVKDGGAQPSISPKAPPVVSFPYAFPASSIVIDTGRRRLYFVIEEGRAYEYPIAVGREGFSWTGTEKVSRKQSWPDWHPPPEMRERDSSLPKKMTGGVRNPLGAVALYLGNTQYRIHGTNDAKSIGSAQSSGCFRMINSAALHLASLAEVGTVVTVVDSLPRRPSAEGTWREPHERRSSGRN